MSEKSTIFKQHLFKNNHMNFFYIFTRESSHCTLQADKSFEPLPIILSEISHLQKWGGRVGGQSGSERRIEVFCENSKKKFFFWGGGLGGSVGGSGSGWGVRVDVNEELKFL